MRCDVVGLGVVRCEEATLVGLFISLPGLFGKVFNLMGTYARTMYRNWPFLIGRRPLPPDASPYQWRVAPLEQAHASRHAPGALSLFRGRSCFGFLGAACHVSPMFRLSPTLRYVWTRVIWIFRFFRYGCNSKMELPPGVNRLGKLPPRSQLHHTIAALRRQPIRGHRRLHAACTPPTMPP